MEIYLIRHTTPAIGKGICYGQSDIPAEASLFAAELAAIKSKIPSGIKNCYSSPLTRCSMLAEQLCRGYHSDSRLMELHFGDWENKNWNNINRQELDIWMQDFVNAAPPNGESYSALHQRTAAFVNDLLAAGKESALIVTHAGNIRSFLSLALGLPLQNSFRVEVPYGALVILKLEVDSECNKLIAIK
ncbi:MAG TPA: alpha-ribazole phosphatase family protein [Flavobacterium sp.]|nr:alpha-ribazole phosphatase family protein [Flavobacterium sp.]